MAHDFGVRLQPHLTPSGYGIRQNGAFLEAVSDCCSELLKWDMSPSGGTWYCSNETCGLPKKVHLVPGPSSRSSRIELSGYELDPAKAWTDLTNWVASWTGLAVEAFDLTVDI